MRGQNTPGLPLVLLLSRKWRRKPARNERWKRFALKNKWGANSWPYAYKLQGVLGAEGRDPGSPSQAGLFVVWGPGVCLEMGVPGSAFRRQAGRQMFQPCLGAGKCRDGVRAGSFEMLRVAAGRGSVYYPRA